MSNNNLEKLIVAVSSGLNCDACPLCDECKVYARWENGEGALDAQECANGLREYVGLPRREKEYKVSVNWVGSYTYTITAENEEEAKKKAIEKADIFDVKYWHNSVEVE